MLFIGIAVVGNRRSVHARYIAMPTYKAVGVTASLSLANLQASLSTVVDLKQGKQQQLDAQRIQNVFAQSRKLGERPIGADGGDHGVMQFLGPQKDLPFFMAEAGESVTSHDPLDSATFKEETESTRLPSLIKTETDSSLTSLEVTPSEGTPQPNAGGSAGHVFDVASLAVQTPQRASDDETFDTFTAARGFLDQPAIPEALRLSISIDHKTFLPKKGRGKATGSDLKIEVFLNGQLSGVKLLNRRGSAVELVDNKLQLFGTRIHRQMEKPWVYGSSSSDEFLQTDSARYAAAAQRWYGINAEIQRDVVGRGLNRLGDRPPSADFLDALCKIDMPDRLKNMAMFGVIDIVITAGKGKKHGPETGYILVPTRLGDPEYKTGSVVDPLNGSILEPGEEASLMTSTFLLSTPGSVGVPVAKQQSLAALPASPTPRRKQDSGAELDLSMFNLSKEVQPYENSRGKTGLPGRTLRQRLGDVKKMSPSKREKEMAVLREELEEQNIRAANKNNTTDSDPVQDSPSKKPKLEHSDSMNFGLNILADAALAECDGAGTMNPMQSWRSAPPSFLLPEGADPEAMLTQNRIDMALEAGLDSCGPLLRRIVSTSPLRTPQKKTRASALANSPCSQKVKEQRHMLKKTPTPQRSLVYQNGEPILIDPRLTGSSAKRSGRGANRTRDAWDPAEHTAQETLKAFHAPELCEGSVIGYGEGDMQRQVGKARGGEFREESLVVGMRFVVV